MGDLFQEILVKRNMSSTDQLKKYALIALIALLTAAGIMISVVFLLPALVLGIVSYLFLFPQFDLEYEYLYVNGEFDIDKIMNKSKRKRCASYSIDKLEEMYPSSERTNQMVKQGVKVADYTSNDPQKPFWNLIFSQEQGRVLVKMELNEEIVKDVRRRAPGKVAR